MIRSYEYFKLFNKEVFYNKLSYIWSLAIPIIFLIINHYNNFTTLSYESFSYSLFFFWGYMVLITASEGIGIRFLYMRDSNFLKMYTYITGSKLPIIFGKIFSQMLFLWGNMLVFILFSGLLYQQPVVSIIFTSFIILIPIVIPIYLLFLISATLPMKSNSIGPLFPLIVLFLTNVAAFPSESLLGKLNAVNPARIVIIGSEAIHNFLIHSPNSIVWTSFLPLLFYLFLGIYGYKNLDLISKEGR